MGAYNAFEKTNERAKKLVELHKELNPRGQPKKEYADILRSAVVLSISAMDAYFHEVIAEKIAKFVRAKKGKQLPGKLVEIIKKEVNHERLIEIMFKERPLSHIANIVRKSIADRTYQDAGKIEDILKIVGVDDLWFQVGKKLKTSKEKAKTFIHLYVHRRHDIVHRGDFGATKRSKNKLKSITRQYANNCVTHVEKFVKAINDVIETKVHQS